MTINAHLLKSIRVNNNKTQQQVADEVGINIQQYARYEQGKNEPKVSVAQKMAASIGTTTDVVASFYANLKNT